MLGMPLKVSPLMPVSELNTVALGLCSTNQGCLFSCESPTVGIDMQDPSYGIEEETGTVVAATGVGRLPGKGTVFSPFPPGCCVAGDTGAIPL